MESKTFCPLPWINISADTDGSVRLCCISDEYIRKETGMPFNLGHDRIEDIINSAEFTRIRQDIISGKEISGCTKCYEAEKNKGISYRQQYIHLWKNDESLQRKYNQSLAGKDIDTTVEYYDLRYGNLCNLSCRSCYGRASSQFNKEIYEIQLVTDRVNKFHGTYDIDFNSWYETDTFTYNVSSQMPNLKEYYSTGGEPTLNEKNYQVISELIETGHSKHCTLKFNTNLTNTKKDFYSLLPHFKEIILMMSVDGHGAMQEYLRYPSNWNQISGNINRLIDMNLSNLTLIMTPVIQITNLSCITDLFEYVEEINRKHDRTVISMSPIVLADPSYLDFVNLPLDYKQECWNKIDAWINEKCKYQGQTFHKRMKQVETKCLTDVDYKDHLRDYFEFTDIFDAHRGESIADINPGLAILRHK